MKSLQTVLAGLALMLLTSLAAHANDLKAYEQMIDNMDAFQAMAMANQWKWTQPEITAHVTSQEVVFEFPNGKVKKVALPKDKMVVAIAPYLTYTHG